MQTEYQKSLELRLTEATMRLHFGRTPAARRRAWADLQRLHKERAEDPQRVADLELERGLTR